MVAISMTEEAYARDGAGRGWAAPGLGVSRGHRARERAGAHRICTRPADRPVERYGMATERHVLTRLGHRCQFRDEARDYSPRDELGRLVKSMPGIPSSLRFWRRPRAASGAPEHR